MRVVVDYDLCESNAVCMGIAPDIFEVRDDDFLYVLDEKGHTVHLTDRGVDFLSPGDHEAFVLPDISEAVYRLDHDHAMSPEDKLAEKARLIV